MAFGNRGTDVVFGPAFNTSVSSRRPLEGGAIKRDSRVGSEALGEPSSRVASLEKAV